MQIFCNRSMGGHNAGADLISCVNLLITRKCPYPQSTDWGFSIALDETTSQKAVGVVEQWMQFACENKICKLWKAFLDRQEGLSQPSLET